MSDITVLPRLRALAVEAKLDAVIAWGGANFAYVSGYAPYFDNPGSALAVIPTDPARQPMLLVASWMADAAEADSTFADIRTFPIWIEIAHVEAIRDASQPQLAKPSPRFDLGANMRLIADALTEMGIAGGTIGIERGLVSIAAFDALKAALPNATFAEAAGVFTDLRAIKTPWEIACIKEATLYAEHGLRRLCEAGLRNLDTAGLKRLYDGACSDFATRRAGTEFDGAFLGTRVTASIGGAISPTIAGGPKITGEELVFFDCGASIHGYGSDTGRTLCFAAPSDEARRMLDAVCAGVDAAEPLLRPGTPMSEIFHAGQNSVRKQGLEWYTRGHIGHAMGLGMGEQGPYLSPVEHRPLRAGMVVALETPLYVRGLGGFQVEECYVITDDGAERFTSLPRDFMTARL